MQNTNHMLKALLGLIVPQKKRNIFTHCHHVLYLGVQCCLGWWKVMKQGCSATMQMLQRNHGSYGERGWDWWTSGKMVTCTICGQRKLTDFYSVYANNEAVNKRKNIYMMGFWNTHNFWTTIFEVTTNVH